jgi:CubicO group peptidase (beta-lactamase class C family)
MTASGRENRPIDLRADGLAAPGYEGVRAALGGVVGPGAGDGAAVAAFVDGHPVVDLWAGAVPEQGLVHTFSAIKPLAATCVLLLAERGHVGLDDPVTRWWPEVGAAGKGGLHVGHLLAHQAGLVTVPGTAADLLDQPATAAALAAAHPDWPPGQAHGEHALTYGNLLGQLVRRVDGRSLGRYLAEEVAGPLGLDLCVGVPAADLGRVIDVVAGPGWWEALRGEPGTLRAAAFGTGIDAALVNSEAWRRGEVPAVNGHATARGLAAFYVAVLEGRVPGAVTTAATSGPDLVLGRDVTWTLGSLQLDAVEIGMGGAGGIYAGVRPAIGLAWAFLTTVMGGIERAEEVERALLAAVGR